MGKFSLHTKTNLHVRHDVRVVAAWRVAMWLFYRNVLRFPPSPSLCDHPIETSYAYSARSEHPAHGRIGQVWGDNVPREDVRTVWEKILDEQIVIDLFWELQPFPFPNNSRITIPVFVLTTTNLVLTLYLHCGNIGFLADEYVVHSAWSAYFKDVN